MRSVFAVLLATTLLVATSCRRREEPVPPPPPAPASPQTHVKPPPAPSVKPAPTAVRPPPFPPAPTTPPPPPAALTNLQAYIALDEPQRLAAVSAIGNNAADPAVAPAAAKKLAELFRVEPTTTVKTAIIDELGFMRHGAALDPVLDVFESSESDEVRLAAMDAAGNLITELMDNEDPRAFDIIVRALDARYPFEVRDTAIWALEDLDDRRALPHLQRLLTDPDPDIRQRASDAIDWLRE